MAKQETNLASLNGTEQCSFVWCALGQSSVVVILTCCAGLLTLKSRVDHR